VGGVHLFLGDEASHLTIPDRDRHSIGLDHCLSDMHPGDRQPVCLYRRQSDVNRPDAHVGRHWTRPGHSLADMNRERRDRHGWAADDTYRTCFLHDDHYRTSPARSADDGHLDLPDPTCLR
jgi:hypothetical protein